MEVMSWVGTSMKEKLRVAPRDLRKLWEVVYLLSEWRRRIRFWFEVEIMSKVM